MDTPTSQEQPNPTLIFENLNAFQRSAALKAAIQLDIFTAIAEGHDTFSKIAKSRQIPERGARILCDYLVIGGLLTKADGTYTLTPDSATFLDRRSPACMSSIANFLLLPSTIEVFMDLAETIRTNGASLASKASTAPDNPIWVEFARSMMPMMVMPANAIAGMLHAEKGEKWKVLDIAAGHGLFGITLAMQNPNAEIFALDGAPVLEVASQNARNFGVAPRHHLIPGSAFDVPFGSGYDVVLLTNFLHHFDMATNETLLRKVHSSLAPGGRAVTLEFVPNDDRVTPPSTAFFSMIMLGQTPGGDAYTLAEYNRMFRNSGFRSTEIKPLPGPESVLISTK